MWYSKLSWFLYDKALALSAVCMPIASIASGKIRQWRNERKDDTGLQSVSRDPSRSLIWVHCASHGEFEQARVLLEMLKKHPDKPQIFLSFFSPSGYRAVDETSLYDWKAYLPLDTKSRARKFVKKLNPDLLILIKNEFWHNHLNTLSHTNIPFIIAYAHIYEEHYLLKSWASSFLQNIKRARHIFVQNKRGESLLKNKGFKNVSVAGDGRIDRVLQIAQEAEVNPKIQSFSEGSNILIAGSVWPEDLKVIRQGLTNLTEDWKILVAPHSISDKMIQRVQDAFPEQSVRLSAFEPTSQHKIMVLDSIGHLASAYKIAHIAYIGGGFGQGIHNILEPAVMGIPVIFGPRNEKFIEAQELINRKSSFAIKNAKEFGSTLEFLLNNSNRVAIKKESIDYMNQSRGASKTIFEYLEEQKLLKKK